MIRNIKIFSDVYFYLRNDFIKKEQFYGMFLILQYSTLFFQGEVYGQAYWVETFF